MAEFQVDLPRLANGEPDIDIWLDEASEMSAPSRKMALEAFNLIAHCDSRKPGLELFETLLKLRMDIVTALAGLTFFAVQRGHVHSRQLPKEVAGVVVAALRLSATNVLALGDSPLLSSESKSQANNVRHMLVALIDDPRVAVVKLAERLVTLRNIEDDADARHAAAREAMEFFAPLAGRLGIWQLKWAMEDLAFRYLYPDEYQDIAAKLDDRREVRERHIEAIRQDLEFHLSEAGIEAEVHGRAKHIYSIWSKMSQKAIAFSKVYDVHALRVLVRDVDTCYRVIGTVHRAWPPIPGEIDDYIANPKENGYRSIHTAVIGPLGKTLEVQIRTPEMHEESELGLCAHWAYKSDADGETDHALQSQKMDWLRSILEWYEGRRRPGDGASTQLSRAAANNVFTAEERIFVATPQGHVLDLPPNATPVDFAYRIHTEIGHRCRGARIDGHEVPLNRRLVTGERVEIETGEDAEPMRAWLNPELGYVNTSRARSKIQSWFRTQLAESNIFAGRALLEESLLARDLDANQEASQMDFAELAKRAGYASENELLIAVGVGDQLVIDLVPLYFAGHAPAKPSQPEASLAEASLSEESTANLCALKICGRDRDGLLRDITAVVAASGISVIAAHARADVPGESATVSMELLVSDPARLAKAVGDIGAIAGVANVQQTPQRSASLGNPR